MSWDKDAACKLEDPELFFLLTYASDQPQVQKAKKVCGKCPILQICAAYVAANPQDDGIWAGQTPRERRDARRSTFTPTPAARKPQRQLASGGCTVCGRLAIRLRGDHTLAAHSQEPGRLADDMTCPGGATPKRRRQEATR